MPDRRRATVMLVVLSCAAAPAWAAVGHKPPTHLTYSVLRATSQVTYSGSCTVRHETDPPPGVTASLAVWDDQTIVSVPVRLTLRPVLAAGSPTGEFIFSGSLAAASAGLGAPLAGRLVVNAPDCELLTLGSLVQDSPVVTPAYAVHVAR